MNRRRFPPPHSFFVSSGTLLGSEAKNLERFSSLFVTYSTSSISVLRLAERLCLHSFESSRNENSWQHPSSLSRKSSSIWLVCTSSKRGRDASSTWFPLAFCLSCTVYQTGSYHLRFDFNRFVFDLFFLWS